jgi:hypothetical protein
MKLDCGAKVVRVKQVTGHRLGKLHLLADDTPGLLLGFGQCAIQSPEILGIYLSSKGIHLGVPLDPIALRSADFVHDQFASLCPRRWKRLDGLDESIFEYRFDHRHLRLRIATIVILSQRGLTFEALGGSAGRGQRNAREICKDQSP